MFWDTVVMADALKSAETHLGPVGRYLENTDPALIGARLYTDSAGIFWYGDIEPRDQSSSKITAIAMELKENVYVLPDGIHSKHDTKFFSILSKPVHEVFNR